jgi:tetratricopeptide (TPR) repeat protein
MQNIVTIDPNSAKAAAMHSQAAQALHERGKLQEAEQQYRASLDADPRHADSLHGLGLLCIQSRRYGEAVELLNRAAEASPDNVAIWSNLGFAYLRLQRHEGAIAAFEKAIAIQRTRPPRRSRRRLW